MRRCTTSARTLHWSDRRDLRSSPGRRRRPEADGAGAGGRHRRRAGQGDVAADGLGVTTGQHGGRLGTAGEVECFQDLHDLPVRLGHVPPGWSLKVVEDLEPTGREKCIGGRPREISCPPGGRIAVRQPGASCPPIGFLLSAVRRAGECCLGWACPVLHEATVVTSWSLTPRYRAARSETKPGPAATNSQVDGRGETRHH